MACRGLQLPPETVREALMSLSSEALPRLLRMAKVPRPHPTRKAEMTTVLDKLLSGKRQGSGQREDGPRVDHRDESHCGRSDRQRLLRFGKAQGTLAAGSRDDPRLCLAVADAVRSACHATRVEAGAHPSRPAGARQTCCGNSAPALAALDEEQALGRVQSRGSVQGPNRQKGQAGDDLSS